MNFCYGEIHTGLQPFLESRKGRFDIGLYVAEISASKLDFCKSVSISTAL